MKKYQYIVAAACVLVGSLGFASIYSMEQSEKQNESKIEQPLVKESESNKTAQKQEDEILAEQLAELETEKEAKKDSKEDPSVEEVANNENENSEQEDDAPVEAITEETLHFDPENGIVWPIEGKVLLDYSMDATIFFPTLQQYQYNPAMILAGEVNSKVYFISKGKITDIKTNEVTGTTVTQDLGDGYTAIYGQLKELNFKVGDTVEAGQVVGYVSEPTKYYSVEGSNVYFQVLKNGIPVDPASILPQ